MHHQQDVATHPEMDRGGVLIDASQPMFIRTSYVGNIAAHDGGGMLFKDSFTNFRASCAQWAANFSNNVAQTGSGGGMFIKLSSQNSTHSDTSILCPSVDLSTNSVSSSQYGPNRASSPW